MSFRLSFLSSRYAIGFERFTLYVETPMIDVAIGRHSDILIHSRTFANV